MKSSTSQPFQFHDDVPANVVDPPQVAPAFGLVGEEDNICDNHVSNDSDGDAGPAYEEAGEAPCQFARNANTDDSHDALGDEEEEEEEEEKLLQIDDTGWDEHAQKMLAALQAGIFSHCELLHDSTGTQVACPHTHKWMELLATHPDAVGFGTALLREIKFNKMDPAEVPLTFPRLMRNLDILPWHPATVNGITFRYHHPLEVIVFLWFHPMLHHGMWHTAQKKENESGERVIQHPFTADVYIEAESHKPPGTTIVGIGLSKDKFVPGWAPKGKNVDPLYIHLANTGIAQWHSDEATFLVAEFPPFVPDSKKSKAANSRKRLRHYHVLFSFFYSLIKPALVGGIVVRHSTLGSFTLLPVIGAHLFDRPEQRDWAMIYSSYRANMLCTLCMLPTALFGAYHTLEYLDSLVRKRAAMRDLPSAQLRHHSCREGACAMDTLLGKVDFDYSPYERLHSHKGAPLSLLPPLSLCPPLTPPCPSVLLMPTLSQNLFATRPHPAVPRRITSTNSAQWASRCSECQVGCHRVSLDVVGCLGGVGWRFVFGCHWLSLGVAGLQ